MKRIIVLQSSKNKNFENRRKAAMKKLGGESDFEDEDDDIKTEFQIDDETAIRLLEENDIKQPIHLNELRLSTMENDVFVDAEPDSVNFVNFHFNSETLDSVGFVGQNFYDKGGKFLARNLTRMPDLDMIALMYGIVFSPMVEIIANESKEYYEKIKLENSDANIFQLPYQLTLNDLENMQELRKTINHILCSEDGMKQSYMPNVSRMLLLIIYKERMGIKILNKITRMGNDKIKYGHLKEKIKSVFKTLNFSDDEEVEEEEKKDVEIEDQPSSTNQSVDIKMEEGTKDEDKDEDEVLDNEIKEATLQKAMDAFEEENEEEGEEEYYQDPDEEMESSTSKPEPVSEPKEETKVVKEEKIQEEEKIENPLIKPIPKKANKKVGYFLNDLIYEKLGGSLLFNSGDKEMIEKEYNKRYSFRQLIKRELDRRIDLYGLREGAIVGERCESILGFLNNLEMKKESSGLCEIKGLLYGLTEVRIENKYKSNDKYIQETIRKLQGESDYDFLCCNFNHVGGIRVKFKYFFTKDSPILFKFPMGSTRVWGADMWTNQFAEAMEQVTTLKKSIDWGNLSDEDLYCTICNIQFSSADQLVDHCNRDRDHNNLTSKFLLKDPENDAENMN